MLQRSFNRIRWKSLAQPWHEVDWLLMVATVALVIVGGLAIRSTETGLNVKDWEMHATTALIGLGMALAIARWRYDPLVNWYWIIYGVTNVVLLLVLLIGVEANGAQRWIPIGGFNVQPSDLAKLGVIVTLAGILHRRTAKTLPVILQAVAITIPPMLLIMKQPDLGTALVFIAITLGMLYWGNANLGWLVLLGSPLVSAILFVLYLPIWFAWCALMIVVGWRTIPWRWHGAVGAGVINLLSGGLGKFLWNFLAPYQQDRIILFINPDKDPLGGGYHLIQSRIAIGAGGMFGQGLAQGSQTQLNFIPEQHTDFIFTVIGEEMGFMGCMVVVFLFWLVCLRLLIIAQNARDNFGSLIAFGVLSMIVFQVLVNIGMTIGLAPVTGIALPWISYGRSSLLTNFIAIGLVESICNFRHRLKF